MGLRAKIRLKLLTQPRYKVITRIDLTILYSDQAWALYAASGITVYWHKISIVWSHKPTSIDDLMAGCIDSDAETREMLSLVPRHYCTDGPLSQLPLDMLQMLLL